MKKIAVVTGARSEYGILKPVLKAIDKHPDLELAVWVAGMHLLPSHGYTIDGVLGDGWNVETTIPMYDDTQPMSYPMALSEGIRHFAEALDVSRPDWLVVLGDRLEPFAAVQSASLLGTPIAHIHGGDRTDGANIDEPIRHSISRFAHLHFPASKASYKRLLKMGEEAWRVTWVGAPALDTILHEPLYSREELSAELDFNLNSKFILCVQHSVTSQSQQAEEQMDVTLRAVAEMDLPVVVIYPNNDDGSDGVVRAIQRYSSNPNFCINVSVAQKTYLSLMKYAGVLVGNSSSGLIEAPSFGLPMVHVGIRNEGRENGGNVTFVGHQQEQIVQAVTRALFDTEYRTYIGQLESPFGDGHAGIQIADRLAKTEISDVLLRKKISF